MKLLLINLCLLTFLINNAYSNSSRTLDFILIKNRIVIKVESNNVVYKLLFDTGSNISIIDSIKASQLNLPFLMQTGIPTPGGITKASFTKFDLFKEFNISWAIASLNNLSPLRKYKIDGLLGVKDILMNSVLGIDFKNKKIHISYPDQAIDKKFHSISLKNGNRSQDSGLGRFFSALPVFEGNIIFEDNKSERVDLFIDTGCHYNFAVITQDSSVIKSYTNKSKEYYLFNGSKRLISFGNVSINGFIKSNRAEVPFFYDPFFLKIHENELIALLGVPFLKKYKNIIINWPERVVNFKK